MTYSVMQDMVRKSMSDRNAGKRRLGSRKVDLPSLRVQK